MSPAPLALTLPVDGAASTRRVLSRFLKKLARDAIRLPPQLFAPEHRSTAQAVLALVRRFGERSPAPLYAALRRPRVHVLLTCAHRALAAGELDEARERATAFVLQLAVELALDGTLPGTIRWEGALPVAQVSSSSHCVTVPLPTDGEPFEIRAGGLDTESAAHRFHPVARGMCLSLVDNNPISDFEAHPDKTGNQLDLGGAPASDWIESIAASLAVITEQLPRLRAEMDLMMHQFVPVGTDDERHLSASYRESIGTVYLTLHPRLMTMAEAVVHEYQHNKINMLFHLDEVMSNAYWPLYDSPVRPDPRPLHGVLLAAHAFVPVAEMYRRLVASEHPLSAQGGFTERFRQIIAKNDDAMDTLTRHAEWTPTGREAYVDLLSLHREHVALGV